jgi:Icc-related predicted phosphoesterase
MKIIATSDLHGSLPEIPECDLLLIAGDVVPKKHRKLEVFLQAHWLDTKFREWLESVPAKKIIGIAGNHDTVFERMPHLIPSDLPWVYLQDQGYEHEGLRIWGTPWTKMFFNWAFMLEEDKLTAKWNRIPEDLDILMVHGPPFGFGDDVLKHHDTCDAKCQGSFTLLWRILEAKPKNVIFGHIHEGYGVYEEDGINFYNVSHMNYEHRPKNKPVEILL